MPSVESATTTLRVAPTAAVVLAGIAMAWREHGSVAAEDWLAYGIVAGLVLAALIVFLDVNRPDPLPSAAVAALAGLALWVALSLTWSPVPSLARDEAFLVSVYGFSFAIPVLFLDGRRGRVAAVAVVGFAASALALATVVHLIQHSSPDDFIGGRLTFPVSYVNANAAVFVLGFWSCVSLAARRALNPVVRAAGLGGATALLALWLATQSKGAGIALGVSAVVVLAVAPGRLRLLVPLTVSGLLVAAAYRPLTGPFRAGNDATLVEASRDAGATMLLLGGVAAAVGLLYALVDQRVELSPRAHRAARILALAALAAALVAPPVVFAARVEHPREFAADHWAELKQAQTEERGGSHLVNLGSDRYDFWRVELEGFRDHPLAGIGARGFAVGYLEERRSVQTPARGHSLPLDALFETGLVGFLLVASLFVALLLGLARRAGTTTGVAALGTFTYFTVHAGGDWIWTFPAVGVPVFALAGIALSSKEPTPLRRRTALAAAGLVALVALAAVPPLLAARITDEALRTGDVGALATARRFDPLSIDPWIAEATLARSEPARVDALRNALEREPRSSALHLLLGRALLADGRRRQALAELEAARRLDPRGVEVADELARARGQ
jgi:O-antigen ligase